MESGDVLYIDQTYTLSGSIPAALTDGRWIRTANADRNKSNSDYLSFYISKSSSVYVALDINASVPSWFATQGFVAQSLQIQTTHPTAPVLRLYRRDYTGAQTVTLGGANSASTGAAANYVVIVK